MEENVIIKTNEFQTPITKELLGQYPDEVQEQFLDCIDTVPLLKYMIGDRPMAKDLPRDGRGRIVVDVTHPHILEDMDYFRPAALFFKANGCYSLLKPNPNPKSEYGKWLNEEVRRCREGYVRESDGEWVTGLMYFYLNYSVILLNRETKSGISVQVEDFPDFWEGIYYRFHYLDQARHSGKHAMELARRGAGKSYALASILAHMLLLGENEDAKRRVTAILTAYLKEYLADKKGTLSLFLPMVDFCAKHTEFPRLMLKRSMSEMLWQMGYKDSNGNAHGSLNQVMGVSVKDDEGKIRGKRGWIFFEEMGNFPNFKEVWNNVRDSTMEGDIVFGLLYAIGTAGDDESDFAGVRTMLYNPASFGVLALDNVYDKVGKGTSKFSYFFPSYMSRKGCMDHDGNSDVVKALLQILMQRFTVKQSNDPASLLSRIAQMPITPAEAILKVRSNYFPVTMLNERLRQLDSDPRAFDDVYVGALVLVGDHVEFKATDDFPLHKWKADNTEQGALEVFEMPPSGAIPNGRYIIGHDPVDNDQAESSSFSSTIVFDLFTDRIVAEYTGRKPFADDNFEMLRLLGLFYNASIMVEANRKGYYAYFAKMHATWMLADCPEYLRDRQLVKYSLFGSAQKGISVNAAIIKYANDLIRDWLCKTFTMETTDEKGEVHVSQVPQLYRIRNRALLEELIGYGPEVNTDRVSALAQVMLYREHFIILYGGSPDAKDHDSDDVSDDKFFDRDWNRAKARLGDCYKSIF